MRLEPTPKPDHILRVSARLITGSTILHLSSEELEQAVAREEMENPALEVSEQRVCLFCGMPKHGQTCANCGRLVEQSSLTFSTGETSQGEDSAATNQLGAYHTYNISDYGDGDGIDDEDFDPLASIARSETLAEALLQQLQALISPDDALIAEQLVGNLNEHGYLEISVSEIAEHLQVDVERVAYVLSQLQTLEPPGIGARDLRECLLIQLEALSEQKSPHPLARTLIDHYLTRLGHKQWHDIARELKVSELEVRQASLYIRGNLHPYPAHTYRETTSIAPTFATYMHPDVIIRKGEDGFEVEIIEEKRYRFHISAGYGTQPLYLKQEAANEELQRYIRQYADQARFFIECVHRRWRTLKRVVELVVELQREFLEKGTRYLHPLTRAEVATRLNLDEGTVSRATSNKYALLPDGSLIPLSDFFDSSLGVKDVLRELIASEGPQHRLSDDELARLLTARGIPMARRTVTKYREEMGIGSSRER